MFLDTIFEGYYRGWIVSIPSQIRGCLCFNAPPYVCNLEGSDMRAKSAFFVCLSISTKNAMIVREALFLPAGVCTVCLSSPPPTPHVPQQYILGIFTCVCVFFLILTQSNDGWGVSSNPGAGSRGLWRCVKRHAPRVRHIVRTILSLSLLLFFSCFYFWVCCTTKESVLLIINDCGSSTGSINSGRRRWVHDRSYCTHQSM